MVPNVKRGYSFKKLSDYLTHDKPDPAQAASPRPQTAERVGFTKLINFHDGEARTVDEAAKVMALMVRDADKIKRDAGVPLTGGKAKAPPVYHLMLSWAKFEQVDEAEMMRAGAEALEAAGLGLDKGYLTCAVSHTDTELQHIHFEVCLVHPDTGKQANPHRDKQKLQQWAREYDRKRGQQLLCPDREAKYAALDRIRSSRAARAAFNDNAKGNTGGMSAGRPAPAQAQPDKFDRSRIRQPRKGLSHTEWEARKTAGNDNRAAQQAADRIKADSAARWSALKAAERTAFTQRTAEAARFYADRKAGRGAIFEKYQTALDGVWKPQGGPKHASPDRSRAWQSIRQQQDARQKVFEANEKTALGRVRNALALAGKGSSLLRTARLAVNAGERQRMFERGQRAIVAKGLPREERQPSRPMPKTPEPKRVQAERLKAMRTKEVTEYTRETTTQEAAMKGRHAFQMTGEKDARAMLSKEIKTAWRQHNAAYAGKPEAQAEQAPATTEAEKITRSAKPDRFGRSRERTRQPRAPRQTRETTTRPEIERPASSNANIGREAENSPVEAGYLSGQFSPAGNEQAPTAQPEAAHEAKKPETEEQRQAAVDAERERQAARDRESEQGRDSGDTGRTFE
jgi:Relaxase/Mobilisation nuclease domain